MAKFIGTKGHTALIYLPHLLAFCSFGILLGGIASMQQACGAGSTDLRLLGITSYLAPIGCDRLFSFDWFITFFQGFIWLALLPLILGRQVHKARNSATGLLIVGSLLLMFMTNTWYHAWSGLGPGIRDNTFNKRVKTTFAGALIGAVADMLMLLFMGLHDERATVAERTGRTEEGYRTTYVPTGAMPGAIPEHVATTEAETIGYRPGPVAT